MSLSVAIVGGGPGGLFAAIMIKRDIPNARVVVHERNRADDTYGFGVVFSQATLVEIDAADSVLTDALREYGAHWDHIEVRLKGERIRAAGNGMAAIDRRTLLLLLQERARKDGIELRFSSEANTDALAADHDLVVAADGANSRTHTAHAEEFVPTYEEAAARFIWFGTTYPFDGLTFVHREGPHGVFAVHGYPISETTSTFIVETDEATWRRAGLDSFDTTQPPGPSDEISRRYLEELFASDIDGHPLLVNNSRWGRFRTRRVRTWHTGNIALLGDAAHTAHFSVGSGTKMAMEDAIALARALAGHVVDGTCDVDAALNTYEATARPSVEKIQDAARPSLSWWEHFGRYHRALEPRQFAFHFMSRAIGRQRIARRDPEFVAAADLDWYERHGRAPLETPLKLGAVTLAGRCPVLARRDDDLVLYDAVRAAAQVRLVAGDQDRTPDEPWGVVLSAPAAEADLPEAGAVLTSWSTREPEAFVIRGGTPLTRVLLAEEARFGTGIPAVIVEEPTGDPARDEDRATTLVLSGRADAVAAPAPGPPETDITTEES